MTELEKNLIFQMSSPNRVALWFAKVMELLEFGRLLTDEDLLVADKIIKMLEEDKKKTPDKKENKS